MNQIGSNDVKILRIGKRSVFDSLINLAGLRDGARIERKSISPVTRSPSAALLI